MASNGFGEIVQGATLLDLTGLRGCKQTGSGDLPIGAAISKTDLAPLHGNAQSPLRAVIGGLYSRLLQERE